MTAELRVDLDALAANLAVIRARVAPAEHMLVVKDDAYGHGLEAVVRRAWVEGVRWFGAFDVRTGSAVRRELGPDARVFVWIVASAQEAAAAVAADLDIGVGDAALLEDVAGTDGHARVHLKVDTGLHRNGIRPEEWPAVVARAAQLESAGRIRVVGIWSHIAEASDPEDDAARSEFDSAVRAAMDAGLTPDVRHLAASAAGFARPEFRYDVVRIGAFAYGIRPAGGPDESALGIRTIATLVTRVTELTPDGVTIGVGALDGIPSSLSGRFTVGTPGGAHTVREIDHDDMVIDRWPGAAVGDEALVFGEGAPSSATDLAEQIGSIGEEIAVRVAPTVPRVYRPAPPATR